MDATGLSAWMRVHLTEGGPGRATAFRLETLQVYEVASDGSDFRRYLDGAATWTPERKEPWLATLRGEHAAGRRRSRVRVVTRPVSDYTRYECEWGYAPNAEAGEDVRILDLGEQELPDVGELGAVDWWCVTDIDGIQHVARMAYASDGRFLGADDVPPGEVMRYASVRDALWAVAEPFSSWWPRHAELHRKPTTAA